MRYNEILQLSEGSQVNEASEYHVRIRTQESAKDVMKKLDAIMQKAAKYGEQFITKDSSSPGGPDTTKFRASHSGQVAFERNVRAGQHNTVYPGFLKIGTGLADGGNLKVWNFFKKEVQQYIKTDMGSMSTKIECPDGTISISPHHGSNWGGYGYFYSDYVYK